MALVVVFKGGAGVVNHVVVDELDVARREASKVAERGELGENLAKNI